MSTVEDKLKDRIRQSERTVDNLKRLYAVLFSLSFGIVAIGSSEKLSDFATQGNFVLTSFLLHVEITISFIFTAGLFYYQGDRFLDIVYAREPLISVKPSHFGTDYFVNVFTMIPFYVMAHALSRSLTEKVGFTWYFLAYVLLIGLGLLLLITREFIALFTRPSPSSEIAALKAFWLLMNSSMLLISLLAYCFWMWWLGAPCPANYHRTTGASFVLLFGLLILARDFLDFTRGWAILYPVEDGTKLKWPLPLLKDPHYRGHAWVLGTIFIAFIIAIIWTLELWNLPKVAAMCAV